MKYRLSFSGGKDSLALFLILIVLKKPLDEVVFFDTGAEFKAIYNNVERVKVICKELGVKFTTLYPKENFFYKMLKKPVKKRGTNIVHKYGYEWCGGRCRWGTTEKLQALEKYCKGGYEYVGLAYDEPKRLEKERKGYKLFPLADLKMTERQCLKLCLRKGFNWIENCNGQPIELYKILKRVSCWCCGNKNQTELRNYYLHLPNYWQGLKDLQKQIKRPFKQNKTIFDLQKLFKEEGV